LYEKCIDLRKICKKSVSFLFSEEIERSLELIAGDLVSGNITDNYSDTYGMFCEMGRNGYDYRVVNTYSAILR